MFSLEDIQEIQQGMRNEYVFITMNALDACKEMDEEFKYNEKKQWNADFLRSDVRVFQEAYDKLNVIVMMIELLVEMETERDQFLVQKKIQGLKEGFEFSVEENPTVMCFGTPRGIFGEKDKRYRRAGEQMAEYLKKAKRVIFEDILGE